MPARNSGKDLSGKSFGRLTVLWPAGRVKKTNRTYLVYACQCDCGNIVYPTAQVLRSGHTKSCGCLMKDINREKLLDNQTGLKHGHNTDKKGMTPTYKAWNAMKQRCTNPKNASYKNYGARGVTYDPRWEQFENFLADMGEKPGSKREYSLDRIDNNKGYYKDNCRWATIREQNRNRRVNKLIIYNNEYKTLVEWSEELDIPYKTLESRIRLGWTIEKAFTTPVRKRKIKQ